MKRGSTYPSKTVKAIENGAEIRIRLCMLMDPLQGQDKFSRDGHERRLFATFEMALRNDSTAMFFFTWQRTNLDAIERDRVQGSPCRKGINRQ